jgi:SlyX protein
MSNDQIGEWAARVEELEIRVAFQEDMLSELNNILSRQDTELMRLKAQLKTLSDKHLDLQYRVDQGGEAGDERPPHY